jgi:lysyl-tRNA synthetase class I
MYRERECENGYECPFMFAFLVLEALNGKGPIPSFEGTDNSTVGCGFFHNEDEVEEAQGQFAILEDQKTKEKLLDIISQLWQIEIVPTNRGIDVSYCALGTQSIRTLPAKDFNIDFIKKAESKSSGPRVIVYNTPFASKAAAQSLDQRIQEMLKQVEILQEEEKRIEQEAKEKEERIAKEKQLKLLEKQVQETRARLEKKKAELGLKK